MKKLLSLLLAMLLVISLVACGEPQDTPVEDPSDTPEDNYPPEAPTVDLIGPFLSHRITLVKDIPFQIALAGNGAPQWTEALELSADTLGTSHLSLSPAKLLLTEDGKFLKETFLLLGTQTALSGTYHPDVQKFLIESGLGVRALGLANSVTDREKDYKKVADLAIELSVKAKNAAIVSMNTYGSTLANIVVKRATQPDAVYLPTDIDALKGIVSSLTATDGALTYIEQAYMQYILGYVASAAVQNGADAGRDDNESAWHLIRAVIEGDGASLAGVKTTLAATGISLPSDLADRIASFEATKDKVVSAQTKLNEMSTKAEYAWSDISSAVLDLANVDAIEINGYAATDVMQHMNDILSAMMSTGLNVTTKTGSGVYADIADHCGNYKANVIVEEIPYGGLVLSNVNAAMEVSTQFEEPNLLRCTSVLETAGAPLGSNTLREDGIKAYMFDFELRAAATNKSLYLQTGPVTLSEDGKSLSVQSTVTFTSDTLNTTTIQSMIDYVRVVFFDTETRSVLATAKPDAKGAYIGETSVVAGLQLSSDASASPIATLSANETAHVSVLIYVDAAALDDGKLSYDAFAMLDSAIQLQFTDTVK